MTYTVFVYGSLKRGFHNHCFLEDAKFLGEAGSQGRFVMWSGFGFPYLATMATGCPVAGELYQVESLRRLDALEGHPHHYRREKQIFFKDGVRVSAWIYLAPLTQFEREYECSPNDEGILTWRKS